jgi:hypothetical protein
MKTDWNSCPMQTHADLRIGSLVRWIASSDRILGGPEDIDELGIVVQRPVQNFSGYYHIAWSTTKSTSHHTPEMIEESLYQQQMEIVR